MKKNFSEMLNKLVANFVPQEENEARLTYDGKVVVFTNLPQGKEWVDKDATIYPAELLSDFPLFTIAKPVNQVNVGDIVKLTHSTFATVDKIENGRVHTVSFGGQNREAKAYKDMFLGNASIRVVVNLLGANNAAGNANMLPMLMLLNKDGEDKNDFVETMMLMSMLTGAGQNPFGALTSSPMALMMLMKGDSSRIQDIMMMQAMQNGGLAGLFGAPAAAPAPAAAE